MVTTALNLAKLRALFSFSNHMMLTFYHRRRIYTEEKAKVVAASWWTELLHFHAVLAILHQDDLNNRLICTRTC